MPRWRALLLVLIAALFAAGTLARAIPAQAAPPACHEDAGHPANDKPQMLAVSCCLGCMPAPSMADTSATVEPAAGSSPIAPLRARPLSGLTPAPDPYPPRVA